MLVCSVVLRPERATLAVAVYEIANASDDPTIGAIFATLTDDPGNARDTIVAFVGQTMAEAASASAVADAASTHPAAIFEAISAAVATQNATLGGVVPVSPRQSMVGTVMVNSDGTARQANADGTMVNL